MRREIPPIAKTQILGFVAVFAALYSVLIFKVFTVPITHDEAWTVINYTKYSTWEIMMYPDAWPNNHILNTLFTKFSCWIFGTHDWSARIPNLLFYIVYAFGVFRFLRVTIQDKMYLFLPAALLFLLSPYFLDFFALSRGYGISSALTMLSLSFFVSGFHHRINKHIWWAVGLALLASYANFTVLVFWAAAVLMAALYFLLFKSSWGECLKRWGILAITSVGYLTLIAQPIYKMRSTDQFEYWTSKGFYDETIFSVVHKSLLDSGVFTRADWVAFGVFLCTIFLWVIALLILFKSRFSKEGFRQPLVIISLVLAFTVSVNLIQTSVLGVPNLNGRTALFLLPIFTALIVSGLRFIPKGKFRGVGPVLAGLIVLIAIQHLTTTVRTDSFKEWKFDASTFVVLDEIESKDGSKVTLATHWLYNNSFAFYKKYESVPWLELASYDEVIDPASNADYYYLPSEEVHLLEERFQIVSEYQGGAVLMKRLD